MSAFSGFASVMKRGDLHRLVLILFPLLLAFAVAGFVPGSGAAAFLIVLTIAYLAVGVWPEYVTAMLYFTLAILLGVAAPEKVFSGFTSSAFWLVLSGFFLGQAVTKTGFGSRVAGYFGRIVPAGYGWALTGTAALAVLMSFLMPSAMGRVLLMLPIIQQLAVGLGYEKGSRGFMGITFCGLLCSFMPASGILPANISNMVLVGSAEAFGLPRPDYAHYLLLHFPVLGLLKTVLLVAVCRMAFRPSREQVAAATVNRLSGTNVAATPWSAAEVRLAVILAGCMGMWCTDSIHGVSPAWVGMVGALICLMPGAGVLDSGRSIRELNVGPLFYVAAIIGIGSVVASSGLGARIASGLLTLLPLSPSTPFVNFGVLGLMASVVGVITTLPGMPAVLTPMAGHLAQASGFSGSAVVMTQVLGFSTLLFPFQMAPLMVGVRMLELPLKSATRIMLVLAVVTILVLWPLDFLWWRVLGYV